MRTDEDDELERHKLLAGDPPVAAARILDALHLGPLPAGVAITDLQAEAADLLSELAADPRVMVLLVDAIGVTPTRTASLDAIALSGEQAAASPLAVVVRSGDYDRWSEREVIKLVSALGSVGGPQSRAAIDAISRRRAWSSAVERELQVARTQHQ
jgi:hypothetical protein